MLDNDVERGANSETRRRLINRDFRLLWAGGGISALGDAIFEITLLVWIASDLAKGKDWAPIAVSGMLIAAGLPTLLVGPLAGAFVDRWRDKRRVMLCADAISAALVLALLPLAGIVRLPGLGAPPVGVRVGAIVVIVILAAGVAQFFRPSAAIITRDIVPDADLPRAFGLNQTASSLAVLIGPPLAAPLLFAFGPGWALTIDAASFLVSFLAVSAVRPPTHVDMDAAEPSSAGVIADLAEGLRFFRRSSLLVTLTVAIVIALLGLGAVNSLDIFFVTRNLGTSARNYGIMSAAYGGGSLAGAAISGAIVGRLGPARTIWTALFGLAGLVAVYSRQTHFIPAVVIVVGIGLVIPALNVAIGPLVMRATPRELLGRVMNTVNPLVQAANMIGMLAGGLLLGTIVADLDVTILGIHFGPIDTIFLGVALACCAGGLYAYRNLRAAS